MPRFDWKKILKDPTEADRPGAEALIAFVEGDHEPLARVLDGLADTLRPFGTAFCVATAAHVVRQAQKGKPGRKKVTDAERIARFLGDPDGLGPTRMSDTKIATFRADQILVDLRLEYPKKRKIPGVDGNLVWLRHEAARRAIECLTTDDGK